MLFTSPVFLLIFLPVMLGIYALTPRRLKTHAICLFSVVFYVFANLKRPAAIVFLFLCAVFTYCASYAVFSVKKRSVVIFAITVVIGVLAVLRYYGVQADEVAARRYLPIGASFYLLASMSCIMDIKRGDAPMPRSFFDILAYVTYFPVMIAGPVIKYKDFVRLSAPESITFDVSTVGSGILLFAQGFVKRVAIAAILDETYDAIVLQLVDASSDPLSLLIALFMIALLLIGAYFSFSGYSDMGRGISAMLGIRLPADFGSPLLAFTPIYYAQNFMRSLTLWVEDYVTAPLSRAAERSTLKGARRRILNGIIGAIGASIILLWFKMGFSALPALAVILIPAFFEGAFGLGKKLARTPLRRAIGWFATLPFIILFWLLVRTRDLATLTGILSRLTLFAELQSYTMYNIISSFEYPVIALAALVVELPIIAGLFSVKGRSVFLTSNTVKWAWSLLLMLFFVFSILFFLPQYPDLATMPFRDIIF